MRSDRHLLPTICLALGAAALLPAQQSPQQPAKNPLRVAYVGDLDPDTPDGVRGAAFVAFLQQRFLEVDRFPRQSADLVALAGADVVLLDWPQSDRARQQRAARWSPLGPRDEWRTPTVLLGSAGLNLAGAWQVRGGFG